MKLGWVLVLIYLQDDSNVSWWVLSLITLFQEKFVFHRDRQQLQEQQYHSLTSIHRTWEFSGIVLIATKILLT